jgi:hypothetical protein
MEVRALYGSNQRGLWRDALIAELCFCALSPYLAVTKFLPTFWRRSSSKRPSDSGFSHPPKNVRTRLPSPLDQ